MISRNPSPLRYPGGKISLFDLLKEIIYANGLQGSTYIEPFAGGAGAGLKLLREGHVDRVIINDADPSIFAFWKCVMDRPEEIVKRVKTVPLTIDEWKRQRGIYRSPKRRSELDVGFAAFFLNRCNRSGIIKNGGPIGGIDQKGEWKIDARFNRVELVDRIEELASYGDRISPSNEDASSFLAGLSKVADPKRCFIYADPPYYVKGRELYLNHFDDHDHEQFSKLIQSRSDLAWVITYDDEPRIRELYESATLVPFNLRYSAHHDSAKGRELLIAPKTMRVPTSALATIAVANTPPSAMADVRRGDRPAKRKNINGRQVPE